jgi:hypothetical protein
MKIAKAIWIIFLLITVLTIPKVINWLLQGLIRVLVILQKTLTYLIKLVEEEITNTKEYEKTSNT